MHFFARLDVQLERATCATCLVRYLQFYCCVVVAVAAVAAVAAAAAAAAAVAVSPALQYFRTSLKSSMTKRLI